MPTKRLTRPQRKLLIEIVGGDVLAARYQKDYSRHWETRRGTVHHATCTALYAKGFIVEQNQYANMQVFIGTPYGILTALQIVSKERFSKDFARSVRKAKRLAEE